MNHGYDDEEDIGFPTPARAGPSGYLAQLLGAGFGMGQFARETSPSAFDDYYKAYSVAVMGGNERPQLLYGGKIIMPPSALAKLTSLDISGPWNFQLINPRNPAVHQTHAGVLEFVAQEGVVHLPAWMMKTLGLNEGDPIKVVGSKLPKGKLVKIQAQSTDFLEVTDAKAVLESALRNYSCLTKGDIIEITYNSLTFEFLIMETVPPGLGISVIDTDLEVDFETPVGYVEPARPAPAPIPTMADKLKIDLGKTTSVSASSSRPDSRASSGGKPTGSGEGGSSLETFTGIGHSLSGRKVKGKGKKIEEVDGTNRLARVDGPKIFTPESLNDEGRKVPAALILPEGKFFFGFKYVPFDPSKVVKKVDPNEVKPPTSFSGTGTTLRDRRPQSARTETPPTTATTSTTASDQTDKWASLGGGTTLRGSKSSFKQEAIKAPSPEPPVQEVVDMTMLDEDDFTFGDEYEDDDDIIEIDSD